MVGARTITKVPRRLIKNLGKVISVTKISNKEDYAILGDPSYQFILHFEKGFYAMFQGLDNINYDLLETDFITESGRVIPNKDLTLDSYKQRSYAYCSDTKYFNTLVEYVKDVDLLYHESTFHSCLASMAKSTFHSTSQDAATVASKANVKKLIIGHFSSRYKDLDILKEDAKKVFENVDLALEGTKWVLEKIYN